MKYKKVLASLFLPILLISGCANLLPNRPGNSNKKSSNFNSEISETSSNLPISSNNYSSNKSNNSSSEHQHTYSNTWTVNDTHHWLESTCEHKGLKDRYEEHTWENVYNENMDGDIYTYTAQCGICGYIKDFRYEFKGDIITENTANQIRGTDGFYYYLNSANGYTIEAGDNRVLDEIVIPSTFNNKPVNKILANGFNSCEMHKVTLPDSIISIGFSAFEGCNNLASIEIPLSVQYIGERAFGSCNNMIYAVFKAMEPPYIGSDLFCSTWDREEFRIVVLDAAVSAYRNVSAQYWAFYASRKVVGISNRPSVGEQGLFYESIDNNELKVSIGTLRNYDGTIEIPETFNNKKVTAIKERGFDSAVATSIILPDTISRIENYAFASCYNLRSITIPENVTYIGEYAFTNCDNLRTIKLVPLTPPRISKYTFEGLEMVSPFVALIVLNAELNVYKSHWIHLMPEYVKLIKEGDDDLVIVLNGLAYYKTSDKECGVILNGDSYNQNINIPSSVNGFSVTSIFNRGFANSVITSITLPNTLKTIGTRAFEYVTGLSYIEIPESVTSIEYQAFGWMTDLKTVKFISVTPPNIGEDVFAGTWDPEDFAILVPNAGLSQYKAISDVYWRSSAVPRLKGY